MGRGAIEGRSPMGGMTAKLAIACAVLAGALASVTAQALTTSEPATAAGVCSPAIEQAIFNATGENTGQDDVGGAGLACNPGLYNQGSWSSQTELQGYVNEVMDRCGSGNRLLVLALLESTGIPPQAGVPGFDNVCHRPVYEQWVDDTDTSGASVSVNWSAYVGVAGANAYNVFTAVNGVMSTCSRREVSHAVVSVTDRYPRTLMDTRPTLLGSDATILNGQCNPTLYRNGSYTGYSDLKNRVIARATSTVDCANGQIDTAYRDLSGWEPLDFECDASRYGNGSWSGATDLRNKVYHSLRCSQPEYGQVYAYDLGRRVRGSGWAVGECNYRVYTDGVFTSYEDLRSKVLAANGNLTAAGLSFDLGGDVEVSGVEFDGNQVLIGSRSGASSASTSGGREFISTNGGTLRIAPAPGSNVISTGGGNVISTGGGNILSDNGASLIGQAGGNVISTGGGN